MFLGIRLRKRLIDFLGPGFSLYAGRLTLVPDQHLSVDIHDGVSFLGIG